MKKWIKPLGQIEKFESNDYVAACWGVACTEAKEDEDDQRAYENTFIAGSYGSTYPHHDPVHCGSIGNQFLYGSDSEHITGMKEINSSNPDAQGPNKELDCEVYSDPGYTHRLDFGTVKDYQTIYWINRGTGRTWHHYGTVQLTGGKTTNHS